jgi:glycosyltransferase involved in cell wall biosynthesis
MRILVWYWGRRGGGAQFALALSAALARRKDCAVALSISRQGELIEDFRRLDLPMHEVSTYSSVAGFLVGTGRVPLLSTQLVNFAREWRADIVVSAMTHLWTPIVAPALARAGVAFVPVVHDAEPHQGDLSLLWNMRLRRELSAARAVVVLSQHVEQSLSSMASGLPMVRLSLGAAIAPEPRLPRHEGQFRFLFFGRLLPYKGLDLLRDAFRLLAQRRPEARLIVSGEGDIDLVAPGLRSMPGVTMSSGWVSEGQIGAVMAQADAVVLPYREASQSGVAPTAFAAGLPVIATRVGGLVQQLTPGVDSLLADAVSPRAVAKAMEEMMVPETYKLLAAGAAESGKRLSDWDGHTEQLLSSLQPFVSRGGSIS